MSSNRLPVLAAEIRRAHADVQDAAKTAAERAIAAGHTLIEAKQLVKHGEWLPWLKEHCELAERTAQTYMRIARSGMKSATVADLGLKAAAAKLAKPKAETEPVPLDDYLDTGRPLEDGEIAIAVADVMCRRDLYPRSAVRPDIVTRYGEFLHDLPPIEINQRNELIDGWHRLEAHKNAGIETIGAIVTEVASDIDHLMLAVKRNSSHGEQLPIEEEREARRLRMQDAPSWPRQKPAAGGR